ncbi:MAG: hypothetical protein ABI353_21260, partial [Isosphaeraceae bacterium]
VERSRLEFLHGLITKTGDDLVSDVKSALEFIGFNQVVDVDATEIDCVNKQEDLQILDRSTKVLVEVKGLGGLPREANTLQVIKFILRRTRTRIWPGEPKIPHGVTLVNHQRGIPPLERDHKNVFTEAQIADSIDNGTGLMTTWDLFRLIRGMQQWQWETRHVQDVFYEKGRIGDRPSHYHRIGSLAHYYDGKRVASVLIEQGETLRLGDTVGYIFPDRFHQETITSLQVDRSAVQEAHAGQKGAYVTSLLRSDLPEGTIVFLVEG